MKDSLCKKYGFDTAGRKERLKLVRLDEQDQLLAKQLHDLVIMPQLDNLIKEYYVYMLSESATKNILKDYDIEKLKGTQKHYLSTLGQGFDTTDYFEKRLKIGLAHALIQMPLSLYQCSYAYLQILLRQKIEKTDELTDLERLELHRFTIKIVSLDMSLATDTYFAANLEVLEDTVTSLQGEKEVLSSKVNIDALTGISSRESILAEADKSLSNIQGDNQTFSLLVADIDFFKKVNDTHGHATGDEVLKKVAERMGHAIRGDDMVGRIGGEEFLITLPGSGIQAASVVGERIRKAIESSPITFQDKEMHITISLGAAELIDTEGLVCLIDRADHALYEAKKAGRNRLNISELN